MFSIIYILSLGFFNRVWGSAWFKGNKIAAVIGITISSIGYLYLRHLSILESGIFGLLIGLGYWFGRLWGLGLYFCCFHARKAPNEQEIHWIDEIADDFQPILSTPANIRRWGTIGMTIRGIYFYPIFLALSFLNIWAIVIGAGVFLMGPIYASMRYIPEKYALQVAEPLYGALLGLLIVLCV